MPKCRFCNVEITDGHDAVIVLIASTWPDYQFLQVLYCSESCFEDGEMVDRRVDIARDPHRERPHRHH